MNNCEKQVLECKYIQENLEPLLQFYINTTHRGYTPQYSPQSRTLFHLLLQVTQNLYRSITYLCADTPDDPSRKQTYILSSVPLLRVLLEILFTVSFVSEDVNERVSWYHKAGWREMKEFYDNCCKKYMDNSNYEEWLHNFQKHLAKSKDEYGVTDEEEREVDLIKRWPIPRRMKVQESLVKYFKYLDDWYYKEFSQASHLSLPGLSAMGSIFLKDKVENEADYFTQKRTDYFICAVMMILSILTEFENIVKYGKKDKLVFLWTFINAYSDDSRELYNQRCLTLLNS